MSYFVIGGVLETFLVVGIRFSYRLFRLLFHHIDIADDSQAHQCDGHWWRRRGPDDCQ